MQYGHENHVIGKFFIYLYGIFKMFFYLKNYFF